MSRPRVGAVTIGQAPRPDLLAPLLERAPADAEVIEVGALDTLSREAIASLERQRDARERNAYPLTTRLRDGSGVTLDESALAPLVQAAVGRAEDQGVAVTLLLCAGGFLDVAARRRLVRPFEAAVARARRLGARRLAIVVPATGQSDPARAKWEAAGFETVIVVGDPADLELPAEAASLDAIVLDYVGHPASSVDALQQRTQAPVIDLGECGADAVVEAIAGQATEPAGASR